MKPCPTSNMNKSRMWGFEVTHIIFAVSILMLTNLLISFVHGPLFIGLGTLVTLRVLSIGQKEGHIEMVSQYIIQPHIFLGHANRIKKEANEKH